MAKQVTELFAFVMIDEDGDEAVPAFHDGTTWLPMIGADMARVASLIPIAKKMVQRFPDRPIRILKFTVPEQIGEVKP